jgi:hypothetical protein
MEGYATHQNYLVELLRLVLQADLEARQKGRQPRARKEDGPIY